VTKTTLPTALDNNELSDSEEAKATERVRLALALAAYCRQMVERKNATMKKWK